MQFIRLIGNITTLKKKHDLLTSNIFFVEGSYGILIYIYLHLILQSVDITKKIVSLISTNGEVHSIHTYCVSVLW